MPGQRRLQFYQADVFTDAPFGGNPVAVFPDADGLTDVELQQIAREMNLSETVFVFPPTDQAAVVKMDLRPSKRDSVFPPYVTKKERMFRNYDCPRVLSRGVRGR